MQLRELRQRLAEVRHPKVVALALDLSRAGEAVREIAQLAAAESSAARARLARFLDHVVLTPVR